MIIMDDTRDIAIRADARSLTNQTRLDGINGQIKKLGDSHEGMREDFNRAIYGEGGETGGLVGTVIELKTTVSHVLKVAGALVAAIVTVCTGVVVYELEHLPHSQQPSGTLQNPALTQTSMGRHHPVSRRERVSGGPVGVRR